MRILPAVLILSFVSVCLETELPSAAAQGNQTLNLVRTATDVASHIQSTSLDGDTAIYIDPVTWMEAMTDSNLGPFLATQDMMPSRSAVCLFSKSKFNAVCVYFDESQPYGVTAIKSDVNHPFTASAAAAAYRPITSNLLQKGTGQISFAASAITLEDGQQLATYLIKLGSK